ncbi:BON domain-containing protein [Baaleninema simplex]|uniref:BON domain-containing protein n=1 Tax=Baaleninema simplex TaxID=2862350 RepID=UPI0035C8B343
MGKLIKSSTKKFIFRSACICFLLYYYHLKLRRPVSVNDGIVTLNGLVDSYFEKWEAGNLAALSKGVVAVVNEIEVDYGCISLLQKHHFGVAKFPISTSGIRSPASWRCRGSGN